MPPLTVVIAAFNESKHLRSTIKAVLQGSYDRQHIKVLVGSDGSTDGTMDLLMDIQKDFPEVSAFDLDRQGKVNVINTLMKKVETDLVVLMDAHTLVDPNCITNLVRHFQNPKVGLVGANAVQGQIIEKEIAKEEGFYLRRENMMKMTEGRLWGTMMGAFGSCYALRRELYEPLPSNLMVDDFYITMKVIESGHWAIMDAEAKAIEEVSTSMQDEFKRKVRMSMGNFQNLKRFRKFLFSTRSGLALSFLSHKVIRWLTPFFLIIALLCSFILQDQLDLYRSLNLIALLIIGIAIVDFILKSLSIRIPLVRSIGYFLSMNLALLIGFFRFIKGSATGMWEPVRK